MEYLSIREMSKKWDIKERKITALCRDEKISGMRKIGKEWMIPNDALKPIDMRTKEFDNYKTELDNSNQTILYSKFNSEDNVVQAFIKKYATKPMYTTFTPYRISPLGAHVDHNLGKEFILHTV